MAVKGSYRIAVRGVIVKGSQFLLLERAKKARNEMGYWELPGGGQDFGEAPVEALKRELMEETRLSVDVGQPLCVWHHLRPGNLQIIGMTFLCTYTGGDIVLSDEHFSYKWVTKDDLNKLKVFPELLDELKNLNL